MRKDKRVRVFYPNQLSRDTVAVKLADQSETMADAAMAAEQQINQEDGKRESILENIEKTSFKNIRRPSLLVTRNMDGPSWNPPDA